MAGWSDYENARNDWMGNDAEYDISSQDAAKASVAKWAQKWGRTYTGDDSVKLYDDLPGQMDLVHNLKSGQNMLRGWTAVGGDGGVGGGGWGAAAPAASSLSPAPAAPAIDPQRDELYSMLMGRAKQSLAVDRNDPNIRAQADAFSAQQERSRRNFLGDLAERSSPYSTGAQLGQARMTAERAGQASGGFEAELLGREMSARRMEIQSALDSMGSILSNDQKLGLQKELALIDDATKRYQTSAQESTQRYGIDSQAGIARDRLGYDYNNSDNALLQQLLGQLGR